MLMYTEALWWLSLCLRICVQATQGAPPACHPRHSTDTLASQKGLYSPSCSISKGYPNEAALPVSGDGSQGGSPESMQGKSRQKPSSCWLAAPGGGPRLKWQVGLEAHPHFQQGEPKRHSGHAPSCFGGLTVLQSNPLANQGRCTKASKDSLCHYPIFLFLLRPQLGRKLFLHSPCRPCLSPKLAGRALSLLSWALTSPCWSLKDLSPLLVFTQSGDVSVGLVTPPEADLLRQVWDRP